MDWRVSITFNQAQVSQFATCSQRSYNSRMHLEVIVSESFFKILTPYPLWELTRNSTSDSGDDRNSLSINRRLMAFSNINNIVLDEPLNCGYHECRDHICRLSSPLWWHGSREDPVVVRLEKLASHTDSNVRNFHPSILPDCAYSDWALWGEVELQQKEMSEMRKFDRPKCAVLTGRCFSYKIIHWGSVEQEGQENFFVG